MADPFDRAGSARPDLRQQVRDIIDYDDARASAPNEHAATLLGAGAFALCALRAQTRVGVVLHAMVAGALLFRAASGRDGLRRWAGAAPARPGQAVPRPAFAAAQEGGVPGHAAARPGSEGSGRP